MCFDDTAEHCIEVSSFDPPFLPPGTTGPPSGSLGPGRGRMILNVLLVGLSVTLVGTVLLSGMVFRAVDVVAAGLNPVTYSERIESTTADAAVVQVRVRDADDPSAGWECTGAFVAQDLVVTAAHCFDTPSGQVGSVVVVPGAVRAKTGVTHPYGECQAQAWNVFPGYQLGARSSLEQVRNDYAVLHVQNCPVPSLVPFEFDPAHSVDTDTVLHSAAYPGDELSGTLIVQTGTSLLCLSCGPVLLRTGLNVAPGSSGSPVWVQDGGRRIIVGIASASSADGTFVRRFDAEAVDFIAS